MSKPAPKINLTPSPSTGSATGNPRNKVALKPGRSLMDWVRLGHSGRDLTGVGGKIQEVTWEELAKHNEKTDAWICLKGKVYNVTSYMEYHPGGEDQLLTGVGQDATAIFNKAHQWVNAESMLRKCLVGHLDCSPLTLLTKATSAPGGGNKRRASRPEVPDPSDLCWSWHQNEASAVTVSVSIRKHKMDASDVIVQHHHHPMDAFACRVVLPDTIYHLDVSLPERVDPEIEVSTDEGAEGVRLSLTKISASPKKWKKLANAEEKSKNYLRAEERTSRELQYHLCTIGAKLRVSHDTRLFQAELPLGTSMETPLGRHVNVRAKLQGEIEVCRNYTPVSGSLDLQNEAEDRRKCLYLMVKIYPKGTLTPHLDSLHVGDFLEISDHLGQFEVSFLDRCCHLVLLAAGTGFTPMVKLIQWSLFKDERRTVKLMFFNKEEKDILWKTQLDELAEKNPRLEVCYVLSEAEVTWKGQVGRVRRNLLDPFVSTTPQEVTSCCVCGPTPFTRLCSSILEEMKFPKSQIHSFQA